MIGLAKRDVDVSDRLGQGLRSYVENNFMGDISSESQAFLLNLFLEDYSKAAARYNAAVLEMTRLQGRASESEYAELKAIVADAREETARTREVLHNFRKRSV